MIEIKIPFKTPSINHLYGHRGFHKYLTKEAKELRKEIKEIINNTPIDPIKQPPQKLKIQVEIHENWLTKKGEIKQKDISNREKFLIDSVFEALELNDKFIYEHTMKKIQDTKEYSIIKIWSIK